MILDSLLQLSSAQAVTAAAAYSTNTVDLGNVTPKRRIGTGRGMSLMLVVTTAAAGDSGSFTNTFDFIAVQSANANLSSHDEIIKRRIAGASLVAGAVFEIPLPSDTPTKQYVGVRYELGTGDTVSVSAFLVARDDVAAFLAYAKNYAV